MGFNLKAPHSSIGFQGFRGFERAHRVVGFTVFSWQGPNMSRHSTFGVSAGLSGSGAV